MWPCVVVLLVKERQEAAQKRTLIVLGVMSWDGHKATFLGELRMVKMPQERSLHINENDDPKAAAVVSYGCDWCSVGTIEADCLVILAGV